MSLEVELVGVNNGIYNVYVIKDDEYIGPCIARGYEWDGWMRVDIQACYKEGTDIIDIGANIGYNTLMFSDYGPVYSFEPVYYKIVSLNAESNKLKHPINVFGFALSDEKCTSNIYLPNKEFSNNGKLNYGGTGLISSETAIVQQTECERLDDVYEGTPSIIKIDVEGYELQVLKGATKTIKEHMPMILIEIHHFDENNEVHKYLKELGYGDPVERPEWMYLYRAKDIFSTM